MNRLIKLSRPFSLITLLSLLTLETFASNINTSDKYAWSTNAGWANFRPTHGEGVTVYADHLEGEAWIETMGWIKLGRHKTQAYDNTSSADYGVNHDGAGNLSGYAWSTHTGWINFNPTYGGVTIDLNTGDFNGYAWSEIVGWINFNNTVPVPYKVRFDSSSVNLSVANKTVNEADTTAITVTATASIPVAGEQTLFLNVTGNGITNEDYSLSHIMITIADRQTTGEVTLTVKDDTEIEGNETVTLTMHTPSEGIILGNTPFQEITIIDNEINNPPVLNAIGNRTAVPGDLLTFQVTATDPENQSLTFSLNTSAPNAMLNPLTGQFSWQTTQIASYPATIQVTDGELTASETLNLIVTTAPSLDSINSQSVPVGVPLKFTARASTYPNQNQLRFSLIEAPEGATIHEKTGKFNWVPSTQGAFSAKVRVTESLGNLSDEQTVMMMVTKRPTYLRLYYIKNWIIAPGGHLDIGGKLKAYPYMNELGNLDIEVTISYARDWRSDESFFAKKTTQTQSNGEYTLTDLPSFAQEGRYYFRPSFAGTDSLEADDHWGDWALVRAVAGYALIIEGRSADGKGQKSYQKTIERVKKHLIKRKFKEYNIVHLSYSNENSDLHPTIPNIKNEFEDLQARINHAPAPLYVIMIDHGGIDGSFYVDNGDGAKIMPDDLNNWLNELEAGLTNDQALQQERVIVMGSCYSGSFIPTLSKEGRTIVTSAYTDEESHKGPKEPDNIRSGEFFIEAFFAQLGRGRSLKKAFKLATDSTEIYTSHPDGEFNPRFQDSAAQHPLLDDNGDQEGSNVLFVGEDGLQSENIYLGIGPKYDANAPTNPAEIKRVTKTLHLDRDQSSANLFAKVKKPNRVKNGEVIVNIRAPSSSSTSDGIEQSEPVEIELTEIKLTRRGNTNRFTGHFDQFHENGKYELLYFVIDSQTGERSPLKKSVVHKDSSNNQPPQAFTLLSPKNDSKTSTTLIFDWENSLDPEDEKVTYTLLLSTRNDFNDESIVHRQEELTVSMTYIDENTIIDDDRLADDEPGLQDGTTYYWKVQATDKSGGYRESPVFSFHTNDTNAPPSIATMHVVGTLDHQPIENIDLVFQEPELDPFGNPLEMPDIFQDQGQSQISLPRGRRRAAIRVAGYQEQTIEIDTENETAELNIKMQPLAEIPPAHGQLQLATNTISVKENQGRVNLIVKRVNGSDGLVSVSYRTQDEIAIAGQDYQATQGQLTWKDKETLAKRIPLTVIDNALIEGPKTLKLILESPTGGAKLGTHTQARVTILNDDLMNTTDPTDDTNTEGDSTTTDPADDAQGTTDSTTTDPANDANGTNDGDSTTTDPANDANNSPGEDNTQQTEPGGNISNGSISGSTDGTIPGDAGANETGSEGVNPIEKTLLDQIDTSFHQLIKQGELSVLHFSTDTFTILEGNKSLKGLTVKRQGSNQEEISVPYYVSTNSTTTVNDDYIGSSGLLTWAMGDQSDKSLYISIKEDQSLEALETIHIILTEPSGPAILGSPHQVTVTITDNDWPELDPSNSKNNENLMSENSPENSTVDFGSSTTSSGTEGAINANTPYAGPNQLQFITTDYFITEGDSARNFPVTRSGNINQQVSVKYAIQGGSATAEVDYIGGSGTLTWLAGDDLPKYPDLTILDDKEPEENETIELYLFEPNGPVRLGDFNQTTLLIT